MGPMVKSCTTFRLLFLYLELLLRSEDLDEENQRLGMKEFGCGSRNASEKGWIRLSSWWFCKFCDCKGYAKGVKLTPAGNQTSQTPLISSRIVLSDIIRIGRFNFNPFQITAFRFSSSSHLSSSVILSSLESPHISAINLSRTPQEIFFNR